MNLHDLRQWLFPREFRIGPPALPADWLAVLERIARPESPPDSSAWEVQVRFLAEVGTGLWRLRQKMVQEGTDRPLEEMRRAYRHFESVWDALSQAGVEIRDQTGQPFDPGMALKVIAFQPTPGIAREKVLETIKPTIYYRNQHIQVGDVIVGTPEAGDETDRGSGTA